ncbi:restriction endonuclease subunit S [Ligilactobacillus ruminis]|uniref:restriction endonuclease subunit S n=1 Tax=Ligilactobacillus ruminis TaxID=1623 RepID=UPI0023622CCB|nr:restriction endonuclease subunit S [Ligilactobacillus ruminis]WDC80836.1 restriction endonuclease subunit S [Ligilactobacillus ruminis]
MNKKKESKVVPNVRFKGFTDDWKQRKLGELAEIVRGASPRPISDSKWFDANSNVGWLRISDVTNQNGRIRYLEQHISKLGQEKTRVITEPHLLLSIAATIGKPLINYVKTGVHDGFLIFLNPKFDLEFMYQWLEMFRPEWNKYGQPGSQVNLNSDLVKNQKIAIPSEEEQQKISNFFNEIDSLITLHQRKIDKLKNLKKAMLEKMFPKKGSVIPEIRFNGFANAWEQRKLGEVGKIDRASITPQLAPNDKFTEYSMPAYDNGQVPQIVLGSTMHSMRLKISGNSLLINKLNVRQKRIWLVNDASKNAVASGEFIPYSSNEVDLKFLQQFMLSDWATRDLVSISSGSSNSQKRITPSDLLNYKIKIPGTKEEQYKIGEYLSRFDNLIALHQRKIDKLKNLKKAMLDQMFI